MHPAFRCTVTGRSTRSLQQTTVTNQELATEKDRRDVGKQVGPPTAFVDGRHIDAMDGSQFVRSSSYQAESTMNNLMLGSGFARFLLLLAVLNC